MLLPFAGSPSPRVSRLLVLAAALAAGACDAAEEPGPRPSASCVVDGAGEARVGTDLVCGFSWQAECDEGFLPHTIEDDDCQKQPVDATVTCEGSGCRLPLADAGGKFSFVGRRTLRVAPSAPGKLTLRVHMKNTRTGETFTTAITETIAAR